MTVPAWDANHDEILNDAEVPRRWSTAPDPPGPIPVRARLVWRRDGEQIIDTVALAWTSSLVLVAVPSPRWRLNNAWLPATDVHRTAN